MASSQPLPDGTPSSFPPPGGSTGGGGPGRFGGGRWQNVPPEARAALHRARLVRWTGVILCILGLVLLFGWLFYRLSSGSGAYGPGGAYYLPIGLTALGLIIVGWVLRLTGRLMARQERQRLRATGAGGGGEWAGGGGWGSGRGGGGRGMGGPGMRTCSHCGQRVGPRAAFCPSCGQRMDPPSFQIPPPNPPS
ncbi:MAG: zinc ribbon domain-containing protein [Thermoplasmata archaeon]|nr:zinc ribbon domain-containing protein [Thermoplasmata archaeon]